MSFITGKVSWATAMNGERCMIVRSHIKPHSQLLGQKN
jgi:hypothetical protein